MPSNRPYQSSSLKDLIGIAEATSDQDLLKSILFELSHRKTKGAKNLSAKISQQIQSGGHRTDLFSDQEGSTPAPTVDQPVPANAPDVLPRRPVHRSRRLRRPQYPPTGEQQVAIDTFMSGDNLKVTAFAEAGKTSTLVQMADQRDGSGFYLAFNKATCFGVGAGEDHS